MKSTFFTRVLGSGALLMTCAVAAQAQKGGHAAAPATRPEPLPRATPAIPATKATPAVPEPGQRAKPAIPATRATPAQPAPKVKPTPRDGDKAEDRAEKDAFRRANTQDKALTHGIRLTPSERTRIRSIEKRYDAQFRDLRKNGATVAQINALRDQERGEIRAVLTSSQQTIFDKNVTRYDARK
jgi:hypothetical protein